MKKINLIYTLLLLSVFTACSVVDPMSSEQYQKDIYIVGANERIASFNVPYGDDQGTFVSLSASGTKKVDKNVEITLKRNDEIITWYNGKYMLDAPVKYRQLELERVNIPSWTATLKAGEIYTRFPFTISTTGLHCDSLYSIGFAIESVSEYQMSEAGTELIFTLKLVNDYSGQYQMDATKTVLREESLPAGGTEWVEQGMAVPVSIQRALTAVSDNTIRFFHEKIKETLAEYTNSWDPGKDYFDAIKKYCINFVKAEGNKFTVEPWEDFVVFDGEAEFTNNMFTFWYDYEEGSTRYRMRGTFRK